MTERDALPVRPYLLALALLCSGCGDAAGGSDAGLEAVRDTVGDTVVVRTVSGSAWGTEAHLVEELRIGSLDGPPETTFGGISGLAVGPAGFVYVVDPQAPALRKFSPDGEYVSTFGREGEGPGEYRQLDGGVATLGDGRVALRDPGNGKILVFSSAGQHVEDWRIRGGMFTGRPLFTDTAGRVYHTVFELSQEGTVFKLAVFDPAGGEPETGMREAVDTLPVPDWGVDPPTLNASSPDGNRRTRYTLPFTGTAEWTVSPLGYFVGGITSRYAVDQLRDAGPLRVRRDVAPVPVSPGERENARERIVAVMRRVDPGWDWEGPPIPETKPPWDDVFADNDGRLWVQLHVPGERIPEEELDEPAGRGPGQGVPPDRWREPVVFDVFEPEGIYLGRVRTPEGFSTTPQPVVRGDTVWATATDPLGVEYVVRYRLDRSPGGGAGAEGAVAERGAGLARAGAVWPGRAGVEPAGSGG